MNIIKRLTYLLTFMMAHLAFLRVASANFVGNDTNNFNPTPAGVDFVTVHSSETLGVGLINFGLFGTNAANALPDTVDAQGRRIPSNDQMMFSDFSFAYGFSERIEAGLTFSTLVNQKTDRTLAGAQFSATGLNEIRLLGKFNLMKRNPIGLAGIVSMNLNQSDHNPFAGTNSGPTVNLELASDYRYDNFLFGLNAGYRIRKNGDPIVGAVFQPLPDQVIASVAANYYWTGADVKLVSEIFAARAVKTTADVDSKQVASELLIGAKYDAFTNTSFQLGGGARLGEGLFTPQWRVYAGLSVDLDILHQKLPVEPVVSEPAGQADVIENDETLQNESFDQLAQQHEFYLRTSVPEKDFSGQKGPFEIIRLENFDFEFGSSEIKTDYLVLLDRLAQYLASSPTVIRIRIEGHTDSLGSPERNRIVSQGRADRVRQYLEKTGRVSTIKMESLGYGSQRPIADNGNFQGRKQNRRVEVRIIRNQNQP